MSSEESSNSSESSEEMQWSSFKRKTTKIRLTQPEKDRIKYVYHKYVKRNGFSEHSFIDEANKEQWEELCLITYLVIR